MPSTATMTPTTPVQPKATVHVPHPFAVTNMKPSQLMVDHSVQRPLDGVRVASIAGDFEPESIGVIHVSRRSNGTYHVMDGQHRVAAMRVLGMDETPVPTHLYEGLSKAAEARMFRRLNNTRQVQALDRFRVRIQEGDAVACEIADILRSHGWTIAKSGNRGSFFAVSAMEKVFRAKETGDPATCDALIRIATAAWGHNSDALRAEIVTGLGIMLRRHPNLDMDKLTNELSRQEGGPLGLISRARQLHGIRNGRVSDAMAEILVNHYNNRRKINRLPEWNAA
jgi:hypothetical protein